MGSEMCIRDRYETTNKLIDVNLEFAIDGSNRPPMKIIKRFKFESRSFDVQFFPPQTIQDVNKIEMLITNIGGGQIDALAYNVTIGRRKQNKFLGIIKPGGKENRVFNIKREDIENGLVTLGVKENGGFGRFVNRKIVIRDGKIKDVE